MVWGGVVEGLGVGVGVWLGRGRVVVRAVLG